MFQIPLDLFRVHLMITRPFLTMWTFFCKGYRAVVITELSDGKKGFCFEVVKNVAGLG